MVLPPQKAVSSILSSIIIFASFIMVLVSLAICYWVWLTYWAGAQSLSEQTAEGVCS